MGMSRTVWSLIFRLHIPLKQGNIVDSGAVFSDALAAAVPGDRLEYFPFATTSYLLTMSALALFIMVCLQAVNSSHPERNDAR